MEVVVRYSAAQQKTQGCGWPRYNTMLYRTSDLASLMYSAIIQHKLSATVRQSTAQNLRPQGHQSETHHSSQHKALVHRSTGHSHFPQNLNEVFTLTIGFC